MKLTQYVTTVLGKNPSPYTLNGTNTYLVGSGSKKILIDTGEGMPEYLSDLSKEVASIQCILITHHHRDHIGGIDGIIRAFGQVPVYKYKTELDGQGYIHMKEGDIFQIDNCTLQVIETPGHSNDHVSLWFPEEKAIFTGDIILGTGSTFLSDYTSYLKSMEKMIGFQPDVLYTAHGEPRVPGKKIEADLQHRKDRENQIVAVMNDRMKANEIMRKVYGNIDERLVVAAMNNTELYLRHLKVRGVLEENNGWWYKI